MPRFALPFVAVFLLFAPQVSHAQPAPITTPKQFFGFNIGDDYQLANYKQYTAYLTKLAGESDRFKLTKIGLTAEGRDQLMGILTSPANHKNLDRYRAIAAKLARAEGVSAAEARKLALEGKAVVWIDAGLHATETLCAQMMMETIYQFVSANDAETRRILDDVIILCVHANPDGMDLVVDWYMKEKDPARRTYFGLPRLYQKYVGHDNNRDFYANTQAETKNMNRVLYREWYPQIMYNHHQSSPAGTVMFIPPFRDPVNYHIDPQVTIGVERVGSAMMERFIAEGKPGVTCRSGATFSSWYNGGLRTTTYYHNMIGLLSETIGHPTPMTIPFKPALQLPKNDFLLPVTPRKWHFRQSIDYSVTANKAVLDYASRNREHLLYNIWLMGNRAIENGGKDSWTITPKMVDAAKAGARATKGAAGVKEFNRYFRDPARRDPRGYIIPTPQHDSLTATKFVNTLIGTGVTVHRAKADFVVAGKKYAKGSYVVKCAQAFRAHVLDMFEPQDHPNDFAYPGAPPTPPYDMAGWTLAYQMGVQFDRVLDAFDGPFEALSDEIPPPAGNVENVDGAVGFFLSTRTNDSFRAVNRLLKAGEEVRRLNQSFEAKDAVYAAGMFYIPRNDKTLVQLEKLAVELGVRFKGTADAPVKQAAALQKVRVGLWDRAGGSMPSGWTRWLLEQFEFPFEVVFTPELDKGNLRAKFDVLVFVDGASVGSLAPALREFLNTGGTVLAIGSSAVNLGDNFGLPIANHLADKGVPPTAAKFYVPLSVLQVKIDNTQPLAWGMPETADVMFANSPTFRLSDAAAKSDVRRVAWFDTKTPLRSGWAWGQEKLEGGVAVFDTSVGRGRFVMVGPQILFRAQPHGTFKLLFNGIVNAGMKK